MTTNSPSTSRAAGLAAILVLFCATLTPQGRAQTWDGGGANNFWSTGLNWNNNVAPANNGTATITFAGSTRLNPILDINYSIASLIFANGAGAFTLTSSGTAALSLGAGGITNNSTQTQNIAFSSLILTANQTWNAASGALLFNGPINLGTRTLTLTGASEKNLAGEITGTGSIIIAAGTARFGAFISPFAGNITLQSGATLISDALDGTGTGTLMLNGGTVRSEDSSNGGRIKAATTIAGDVLMDGVKPLEFILNPTSVSGNRTLTVTNTALNGITFEAGLNIGAGNSLTRIGAGRVRLGAEAEPGIPAHANSIGGTLNLNQGTTLLNGPTTLNSGGALNLNDTLAPGTTFVRTISDLTVNTNAVLTMNSGTLELFDAGRLVLNGGTLNRNGGALNFSNGGSLVLQNSGDAFFTGSFNPSAGGTVSVTGSGSLLSITGGEMSIYGGATVNVAAGGAVGIGGRLNVGLPASPGTLLIDGANSTLSISGAPNPSTIGAGTNGVLTARNGALVLYADDLYVGNGQANANGTLNIESDATVSINAPLFVADSGVNGTSGTINLSGAGSTLNVGTAAGTLSLGASSGSIGVINVGEDTLLKVVGGTTISTTGTLNLNGGTANLGALTANGGRINFNAGTLSFLGNLEVNALGILGPSPNLTVAHQLILSGTTTVSIFQTLSLTGGSLTTGALLNNAFANFLINAGPLGVNGLTTNAGNFTIDGGRVTTAGLTNTGTLALNDGGELRISGAPFQIDSGSATINAGGLLQLVNQNAIVNSGGTLNFNGAFDANFNSLIANSGGTINYNNGAGITAAVLSGNGSHQVGAGGAKFIGGVLNSGTTLQLNGATTLTNFTANGTIESDIPLTLLGTTALAGMLAVNQSGVTGNGALNLTAGGLLDLNAGTFTANAPVTAGLGSSIDIGSGATFLANAALILDGGTLTRATNGNLNFAANTPFTLRSGGQAVFNGSFNPANGAIVSVRDAGSALRTVSGDLNVSGNAAVNILGGGVSEVGGRLNVGTLNSPGSLVIDGSDSRLNVAGGATDSNIGAGSVGTLTARNGAEVFYDQNLVLGNNQAGANGTLNLQSGAGVTVDGALMVGFSGISGTAGAINLSGFGSSLDVTGTSGKIFLGTNTGSTGVINLGSGATLTAPAFQLAATGILNLNGGTANLGALTAGSGVINLNSGALSYIGNLTLGANQPLGANLTLSTGRALTLTGNTNVPAGQTLTINGGSLSTGSLADSGNLVVSNGGTLAINNGSFQVAGVASINSGGLLQVIDQDIFPLSGGALSFNGSTTNLGFNSIRAATNSTVTFDTNARLIGGFLRGEGAYVVGNGGARFSGTTLANGASMQLNGATTLTNFNAAGAIASNAALSWDGGELGTSGVLNLNAGGAILSQFSSSGVMSIANGNTVTASQGDIALGAGSRTMLVPGATLTTASGREIEVNGGLLVNNGTINGTTNVNFGGLVKGAGAFGSVNVYDGGRFAPGNSPGRTIINGHFTFNAGGTYEFELNTANVTMPGVQSDLLDISGMLLVNAGTTANSRFSIQLVSLNSDNEHAPLSDFDSNQPYSFVLATAAGGISGFTPNEFTLNLSSFQNNLNGGTFAVAVNGNNLVLNFAPVPEPSTIGLLIAGAFVVIIGVGRRRKRAVNQDRLREFNFELR